MKPEIRIAYEDKHLLVAWKPHGLLTSGNSGKTFRFFVRKETGLPNVEPCHRLDFATAGWIIFGKTKKIIHAVNQMFRDGMITKHYWAICHGTLPHAMRLNLPIEGKPSETQVQRRATGKLAQSTEMTAAIIQTLSGRTHQIRKHLHAAGHGIVGDEKYSAEHSRYTGRGLFLCAHRLALIHPITGQAIKIEALPSKKFRSVPWIHKVLDEPVPNQRVLPLSSSEAN